MLCGTVGFLEAAADAPAKSTQSESDQQTLRCSRWWWKILMLILIMAMVTVVTPPPPACVEKGFFILYCNIQDGGWWDQPPGEQMPGWYLPADCRRLQGAFFLQSRLFQCNANLTDLVFWIVLD